jgi:predicted HTH transcriptional regulator
MVEFKVNDTGGLRPEMRPEKLSVTELEILGILKSDPSATTRSIAEQLGVVKSTITRNITKHKDRGIIKRVGSTKQGQWIISENHNS